MKCRQIIKLTVGAIGMVAIAVTVRSLDKVLISPPAINEVSPSTIVKDISGRTVDLKSFTGKLLAINVWATWCPPCEREMPMLRAVERANRDIVFLYVNYGESTETVRTFLEDQGIDDSNVMLDSTLRATRPYTAGLIPSTLFIAPSGQLVDRAIGEMSEATLTRKLESLREKQ